MSLPPLPPDVDLAWHDPDLEHAIQALSAGTLTPALELLGEVGSVRLPELRAVVDQRTDDVDRLLLLGSALTSAAWNARGSALAELTPQGGSTNSST